MQDSLLDLMNKYCLDEVSHNNCSLRQHLIATYNILEGWNLPEDVCKAGLFHSIYGTETFSGVEVKDRDVIQQTIGKMAEQYVYLFCCLERESLLKNLFRSTFSIKDRFTGQEVPLTHQQCSVMFQILAANFLEQGPRSSERYLNSYRFLLDASEFLDERMMGDISKLLR